MEAEGRLTLIGARAKKGDYLQLNWREMKMKGVLWNWMMVLVVGKKRKQKKKEKKESDSPKWKGGGVGEIPWQWGASPRGDIEPNLRCPILSKGFRPIPTCVCVPSSFGSCPGMYKADELVWAGVQRDQGHQIKTGREERTCWGEVGGDFRRCRCIKTIVNNIAGVQANPSLGGLEPPTFQLTAERANQLHHRDQLLQGFIVMSWNPNGFPRPFQLLWKSDSNVSILVQPRRHQRHWVLLSGTPGCGHQALVSLGSDETTRSPRPFKPSPDLLHKTTPASLGLTFSTFHTLCAPIHRKISNNYQSQQPNAV